MKAEEIKGLIARGETISIEFKGEKRKSLSDREIYEAVICMANAEGGTILIGVEDDGQITGARPRHGTITNPNRLEASIFNNTSPPLRTKVALIPLKDHSIITIQVPLMRPKIVSTRDGKCLRRVIGIRGPECIPYYPHEQRVVVFETGEVDYSAQVLHGVDFSNFDPLEIERLRQTIRQRGGEELLIKLSDEDLLKALGMVVSKRGKLIPNVSGLLLIGRRESIETCLPTHKLAFQVLDKYGNVMVNDWFQDPLLKTLDIVEGRFRDLNREREAQIGFVRFAIPDYSPESYREAVLNAVQHRNYALLNTVYIQVYPDHLFITSPGGFPEGITLENLLVHEPKPRNQKLTEIMRRIGLVETTGRGIDKIYLGQLRYGRGVPDYTQSDNQGVRLVLRGGRESSQFAVFVAEEEKEEGGLTLDELLILDHLRYERRIDSNMSGKLTQRGTSHGRAVLERLNEGGFVEARGEKRGRIYHLSAALYKKLGLKSGYIRTRGFDRIRQEAMAKEYARAHGRIVRAEAAELCNISGDQASRLLRKLAREGVFKMKGTRRGSYYEPVDIGR